MIDESVFVGELDRLVEGLSAKPLSEGQASAIYATVVRANRLSVGEWKRVVDLVLANGRWPSMDQWTKFSEWARSSAQGERAVSERRCECGTGTFERQPRSWWFYIGPGKFVYTDQDPQGGFDRTLHPERWTAAHEYACSGCHTAGWLILQDGVMADGRKLKAGDFKPSRGGGRAPKPQGVLIPSTDRVYERDEPKAEDYQLARRALLGEQVRKTLKPRAVADRLLDLADRFPEKAPSLVAEATALVEALPRSAISGAAEDEQPGTPTLRDAGVAKCDHRRTRLALDGMTVCADCAASRYPSGWSGGSIDAFRWPWTASEATRWWIGRRLRDTRRRMMDRSGSGSGAPPASAVTPDAPPARSDIPAGARGAPNREGGWPPVSDPGEADPTVPPETETSPGGSLEF